MVIAAIANYAYAIVVMLLLSEVQSTPLIIAGWIAAGWCVMVGSVAGWKAFNE